MNQTRDKKTYDSDFCGSLPLHLINLIQPYGVLVVLDSGDLSIIQVSENANEVFGVPPQSLVETSFEQYIQPSQAEAFRQKVKQGINGRLQLKFALADQPSQQFTALVQLKEPFLLLELEKSGQNSQTSFTQKYEELKEAIETLNNASSAKEVCELTVAEMKKISGFDKVMVYQFDEDWNGNVVAEIAEPGMNEYLGFRFPASDIPKQARDLYLKNPYRLIPTREYTPVRLYPVINPVTGAFLDLSSCNLRSVPAVHLEYLKNMEVVASMSVRIIKDGRLWGLIACHHREEKYINLEVCSALELISNVISARITSIADMEELTFNSKLKDIQSRLMRQMYFSNTLSQGLFGQDVNMMELLNAGGVALVNAKQVTTMGDVPTNDQIKDIVYWLQSNHVSNIYHVTSLSQVYESGERFSDVASGIIVMPINANKGEYIIGFRPEVIHEVNWGGNPDEAINFENDGKNYHPRNSFRLWKQTVRNSSLPWKEGEVTVAGEFRDFISDYLWKKS